MEIRWSKIVYPDEFPDKGLTIKLDDEVLEKYPELTAEVAKRWNCFPDMLEALEQAFEYLDGIEAEPMASHIKKAIAKAKGES